MRTDGMVFQSVKYSKAVKPPYLELMRRRIWHDNKNVLSIFVGTTGSGKSYSALRAAEILDHTFNIDRVCFSTIEFLTLLRNGIKDNSLKKGMVIMYDELGIGHSNRNFQDGVNKCLNFIMQGFRKENLIVFMTVPKFSFIDKQVRELAHYVVKPEKINKKFNVCWCSGYVIDQNPMGVYGSEFIIRKSTIAGVDFDGVQEMDMFGLQLPSERLRIEYEEKKRGFLNDLYDRALATAKSAEKQQLKSIGLRRAQVEDGVIDADI